MTLRLVGGLVCAVLLFFLTLAASAKFDTPSRSETVERVIDAPREEVWAALADIGAYGAWNPYVTRAAGSVRVGSELDLELSTPGEEPKEVSVKVLTATFERKLRWEDRLVLPGVRDSEVTFRVVKLTPSRVRLVETVRLEGLLAPLADLGATREGLELMAAALERRVEERP